MGFSVSGATAILFAAMLIAFGMWHSAATDGFERVSAAEQFRADDALAEENTAIELTTARYVSGTLVVKAKNTGATALSLNRTDIVVDNEYKTGWQGDAEIDDQNLATDMWLPGETFNATFSEGTQPNRVTVATERGVSDSKGVTT